MASSFKFIYTEISSLLYNISGQGARGTGFGNIKCDLIFRI